MNDDQIQKTQFVRIVFDVALLGPFMIWASSQIKPKIAGDVMMLSGLFTILYNAANYVAQRKRLQE